MRRKKKADSKWAPTAKRKKLPNKLLLSVVIIVLCFLTAAAGFVVNKLRLDDENFLRKYSLESLIISDERLYLRKHDKRDCCTRGSDGYNDGNGLESSASKPAQYSDEDRDYLNRLIIEK